MDKISAYTEFTDPQGNFRYGAQAGGVPPTPVKAEWLNILQAELCNLVLAFLPALDKDDNTQLLQAVRELTRNLAVKASTLAGYGIQDAYTKNQTDFLLSGKANNAITLGGYGIGDAYTKVEINELLSHKVAIATTLAEYGITDAYTIAVVDQTVADLNEQIALRQLKNSASFGAAASWVRDGSTGAFEQFGLFNMAGGANEQVITFPVAFPTACRSVVLTNFEDSPAENNIIRVLRWDQYSATVVNSNGNTFTAYSWIAKGN